MKGVRAVPQRERKYVSGRCEGLPYLLRVLAVPPPDVRAVRGARGSKLRTGRHNMSSSSGVRLPEDGNQAGAKRAGPRAERLSSATDQPEAHARCVSILESAPWRAGVWRRRACGEWSVAKLESTVRLGEVMTPRTAASLC